MILNSNAKILPNSRGTVSPMLHNATSWHTATHASSSLSKALNKVFSLLCSCLNFFLCFVLNLFFFFLNFCISKCFGSLVLLCFLGLLPCLFGKERRESFCCFRRSFDDQLQFARNKLFSLLKFRFFFWKWGVLCWLLCFSVVPWLTWTTTTRIVSMLTVEFFMFFLKVCLLTFFKDGNFEALLQTKKPILLNACVPFLGICKEFAPLWEKVAR